MRPLLQQASRSLLASNLTQHHTRRLITRNVSTTSWAKDVCLECESRASSGWANKLRLKRPPISKRLTHRQFSSSHGSLDEKKSETLSEPVPGNTPSPQARNVPDPSREVESPSKPDASRLQDPITQAPDVDLPSHREAQRWDLSKRVAEIMDDLLPKLAIVTQKVNTYTGTDYSSINSLRREIQEQERLVKRRRNAIDDAKGALDAAHSQQAAAQKEVVALLERKHSWSATDLERYMSLIRSEHLNDQAVREAKDAVLAAENSLEEARTQLEKRERAQYHEEQIWSDTIRRNSTWVTFGLMGVNIFLLLTSLLFIEPWRRRRMVREIKNALDAQKTAIEAATALPPPTPIEAAIDEVVQPVGERLEDIAAAQAVVLETPISTVPPIPEIERHSSNPEVDPPTNAGAKSTATEETPLPLSPVIMEPIISQVSQTTSLVEEPEKVASIDIKQEVEEATTWQEIITARATAMMSEERISIRQKDLTNAVLEGAAIGAVITGVVLQIVFRQR